VQPRPTPRRALLSGAEVASVQAAWRCANWEESMTGPHLTAAVRALLRSGLTVRDVAEIFRAHPRAIEALIA